MTRRLCCALLFLFAPALLLLSQTPIRYQLGLDDIGHHELHVSAEFSSLPRQVLQVRMPRASPGRYALHEFAKNVYDVRAFDEAGKELTVYRATPHQWDVAGHDGYVRFEYTLFANHGDGTYSGVDNRKLHLNMPATFVYGVDMQDRPVELHIDLSGYPDWRVATQLEATADSTYRAPDYYYFYDSPVFAGDIDFRHWTSVSNGRYYTIEVAMLHEGTDTELDDYAVWVQQVVEEQKAVFGELPDFDFGRYTFLCSYNPWVYGDGMEHRNSTICSSQGNLADNAGRLIGTISHEFFHAWNVERLRPQSLEPFDFEAANLSEALWFAEGFTSYYTDLILCRAGIRTPEAYIRGLSGRLNYVLHAPGRQHRSPVEMSYTAPFVDAASTVDQTNFENTFVSYYTYGAVLGLVLDLTLRADYNTDLDAFMRRAWQEYGKPEVPYRLPDLERLLAEVSGDEAFARRFFRESIYGSALPDITALLARFGVEVQLRRPGMPRLPNDLEATPEGVLINSAVPEGTPFYEAGINRGDLLLELAGQPLNSADALAAALEKMEIGRQYRVKFLQNGRHRQGRFTLTEDPSLETLPDEDASEAALERRAAWLKEK